MVNTPKDLTELQNITDAMQHKTVLVIGDIMLDRFIYGAVNRISPESAAPVLDIRHETVMPGGAGNVAGNLRAMDVKTYVLAVIGDDAAGKNLVRYMDDDGELIVASSRPTTV